MDYVIYTFGGGDLLWHVFNGIGRVFASNSEYFTPVGHLALTIGGIWAATRAIFRGNIGIFAMEWFFPSIFIFTLLFAPKSTVWLKDEVSMSAPVKVDNIPIGIAMFASLSSQTSYFVSKMLENHLLPAYEGLSSRKTGIMFGAKAVAKIRDVQIHDPVTLTNTKEFLRQCFMKPYIIGNILGKKAAAQQTNDIIGFIEQNIPNNFGIYYREPSNLGISFKTCRQATPLIKAAIHKELNEGLLTKFAAAIGVQSDQSHMLSQRLKVMIEDTLKYLQREQQDIHEWMKQAMLLNANRESYDDWREKFSLSRIYPNLVSMHAIRGLFQQSFSYLVAGEMAAHMMPILQSVFFALVVSMIFIVFPMGLLPGGYNILKTWILLIIWVSSWPVFFAIIHCLGMISLSSKSGAFGSDYGLNMLSQGSFAEMILYSYATFQMLASSIPMLSWGVLKACAHATANLASQFSPMPVASSLGSNIVDNNLSMDNYSIGNRTISQQNLAPSLDMTDSIINYGSYKVVSGNNDQQFVTQDATAYHNKGYVLTMLKRYSEAIESCNLAIKYNPNCAEAYYRRGMIFEKLGEQQKAIENYDIAIKYKPNFAENYLEKGISLVSLGQYSKAKENFNLAIKYMPNLIAEYEATIKRLTEFENFTIAKDYEQKLQILKKYS
ncbi:tetratricopeptide repeat protein [Orientia tsutsugamushi]|nr:tetratricopeptide repeat protein [Orientia tsutsugamushi]